MREIVFPYSIFDLFQFFVCLLGGMNSERRFFLSTFGTNWCRHRGMNNELAKIRTCYVHLYKDLKEEQIGMEFTEEKTSRRFSEFISSRNQTTDMRIWDD